MIPQHEIEEVLSRVDMAEVASDFLTLKKSGSGYMCNCPFHQEKTPSFHIYPARNIYKCFGCGKGGGVVSFLKEKEGMSFMEAIQYLANKYHVTLHDQAVEETDEQRRKRLYRESVQNQYEIVQKFYEENIRNADKEAVAAYQYAKDRWSDDFVANEGIGYAYTSNGPSLYEYAKSHSLSIEILKELHLLAQSEDGRIYDFFRGRIMIPIRDRSKHVIGYTSRVIPGVTDKTTKKGNTPPKYINSTNSEVYSKENTLFGIDQAWIAAASQGRCYCVEGAPDALRLHILGFKNAVACLGSDWTDHQLALLRKRCDTLCFIPDSDPPKAGEQFGVGINKVIKAGTKAFQIKFKVFIKEIGTGDKGDKRDADSFFKTKSMFDQVQEEDFILWYARKLFPPESKNNDKANEDKALNSVAIISDILSYLEEGFELNHYIDQLNKIHPPKLVWQSAIKEARVRRAEEQMKQNLSKELDLLKELGFGIEFHSYYSLNQQGGRYVWSNFTMKPLYHIKDTQSAIRLYEMTNKDGHQETVELRQEDLISLARFRQKVESLGNYIWLAKEEQLQKLKQYLYKATETAELIKQLGWNQRGFYAFGNGIAFHGSWYKVDTLGIVRLPENMGNYYLPAFSEVHVTEDGVDNYNDFDRRFIHDNRSTVSLHEYTSKMVAVFGNKAIVGICFYLATLFRDIILREVSGFPLLNLFGPKGSGKTELGHSLMAFFMSYNKAPNLTTSTLPTIAEAVGQVANALIHLDEFKNNLDTEKFEFLKGLWDSVGRSRMNLDTGKKRETSKVNCGVIVSGQELASRDIALFSRFVFLSFDTSQFSKEQLHEMEQFREIRKRGCSHLTLDIIKLRPQFEQGFQQTYYDVTNQLSKQFEDAIEGRILGNWAIIIAAFKTLENYLNLPFDYTTVYKECCALMEVQNLYCRENNEIAKFWKTLSLLVNKGILYEGCDFHIKYMDKILLKVDSKTNTTRSLECVKPVLLIRNTVFDEYKDYCVSHNESYLSAPSLRQYLKASKDYIGTKAKEAFTPMINGQPIYQEKSDKQGVAYKEKARYVGEALCFDYSMTCELYEFSLASTNIIEESADDDGE